MFVEGVLWIVRTGSPWRDLSQAFGDRSTVFRRFSRWSLKGVWWRIFEAMFDDATNLNELPDPVHSLCHPFSLSAPPQRLGLIERSMTLIGKHGHVVAHTDEFHFN